MTDAEGIRNLVGTGIVQLLGGLLTAVVALGYLFWLNWHLTTITLRAARLTFGGMMAVAFRRLRPIFKQRSILNAEVTGRLAETLGGIRIVKAYTAERREALVFTRGAHRVFRNVAQSMVGVSAVSAISTVIVGLIGVLMIVVGGRAIIAGTMTVGEFVTYIFFTGMVAAPLISIASIRTQISEAFAGSTASARSARCSRKTRRRPGSIASSTCTATCRSTGSPSSTRRECRCSRA